MDAELAGIARQLGAEAVTITKATWGSKNRTAVLSLSDGRDVVVQRYRDRRGARLRVRAAEQLSEAFTHLSARVPHVLGQDLDDATPWAAFERLPGAVGYVAAGDDLSSPRFPAMARSMGEVVRTLQQLAPDQFDLPDLWSHPSRLQAAVFGWLDRLTPHLAVEDIATTRDLLQDLPDLFAGRPTVVAHGDFGPQNVLIVGDAVTAVLDFEDTRLADPLLDIAWWAWLVRAHTPVAFQAAWKPFIAAAGVDVSDPLLEDRLITLVVARLLETADTFRRTRPEKYPSWGDRLAQTLTWRTRPFQAAGGSAPAR